MTDHAESGLTLTDFLLARFAEREAAINFAYESGLAFPILSPAEMLADVVAKRRIAEASRAVESVRDTTMPERVRGICDGLRVAMAHMVRIYADHPDYREEWAA